MYHGVYCQHAVIMPGKVLLLGEVAKSLPDWLSVKNRDTKMVKIAIFGGQYSVFYCCKQCGHRKDGHHQVRGKSYQSNFAHFIADLQSN